MQKKLTYTYYSFVVFLLLFTSVFVDANCAKHEAYDKLPWSFALSYSRMRNTVLNHVLRFDIGKVGQAKLYSADVAYQLSEAHFLRCFFHPLVATVAVAMNVTYQEENPRRMYEFNPHLIARWTNFPWNSFIKTTLAFGEGVSYATHIPERERRDAIKDHNAKRFLNYLLFEGTLGLPAYPQWQILYRIHHRSGVFGLYSKGITGSTAVGAGIRYRFR